MRQGLTPEGLIYQRDGGHVFRLIGDESGQRRFQVYGTGRVLTIRNNKSPVYALMGADFKMTWIMMFGRCAISTR